MEKHCDTCAFWASKEGGDYGPCQVVLPIWARAQSNYAYRDNMMTHDSGKGCAAWNRRADPLADELAAALEGALGTLYDLEYDGSWPVVSVVTAALAKYHAAHHIADASKMMPPGLPARAGDHSGGVTDMMPTKPGALGLIESMMEEFGMKTVDVTPKCKCKGPTLDGEFEVLVEATNATDPDAVPEKPVRWKSQHTAEGR